MHLRSFILLLLVFFTASSASPAHLFVEGPAEETSSSDGEESEEIFKDLLNAQRKLRKSHKPRKPQKQRSAFSIRPKLVRATPPPNLRGASLLLPSRVRCSHTGLGHPLLT